MTPQQIATYMEERKWDYRSRLLIAFFLIQVTESYLIVFGFASALLESLPILGLFFAVSNQIGAAMWAHGTSPYP